MVHGKGRLWDVALGFVEPLLVPCKDFGYLFTGNQSSIDLDGASIWHKVDLDSTADHSYICGWGTEERVNFLAQRAMFLLKSQQEFGHVFDGIDTEVGFGAVSRFPICVDFPSQNTFAGDDCFHFGRFGDDCGIGD